MSRALDAFPNRVAGKTHSFECAQQCINYSHLSFTSTHHQFHHRSHIALPRHVCIPWHSQRPQLPLTRSFIDTIALARKYERSPFVDNAVQFHEILNVHFSENPSNVVLICSFTHAHINCQAIQATEISLSPNQANINAYCFRNVYHSNVHNNIETKLLPESYALAVERRYEYAFR